MKHLVISIHDVSPLTREVSAKMIGELRTLGVAHISLLVIPDHHHHAPFLHDPGFCSWLNEQHGAGHEIVIHGYFHQRPPRAHDSPRTKIVTRFYTAGEGEFYDLDERAAGDLLKKARYEFAQLGLHPSGFIAPAWLLSGDAERVLPKFGIEYTTRLATVSDLKTRAVYRSQSLVWSVRSAWRRMVSLRWNALLYERLRPNALLRVGIHPPDFEHPKIWAQTRTLISRALVERTPITYHDWVFARRS